MLQGVKVSTIIVAVSGIFGMTFCQVKYCFMKFSVQCDKIGQFFCQLGYFWKLIVIFVMMKWPKEMVAFSATF
jgi:hypothetical protein